MLQFHFQLKLLNLYQVQFPLWGMQDYSCTVHIHFYFSLQQKSTSNKSTQKLII